MKIVKTPDEAVIRLTTREAEMLRALVGSIGARQLEFIQRHAIPDYSRIGQLTYGDEGEFDVSDLCAGLWGFLR